MSAVQERERRVTAGKRISYLAGQELENDEIFWTHDTWQEDSESFHSSDVDSNENEDVFDSDFDLSENENEINIIEEQIGAATEREIIQEERINQNKKKNHAYSDIQAKKQKGLKQQPFGSGKVTKGSGTGIAGRRWPGNANGKRVVGDGLNAGIVLNVPIQYQKNYIPPPTTTITASKTATTSTLPQHHEQQSTNTTQSLPLPIPSIDNNTQQSTIDTTLSTVVSDNNNGSIPPVTSTELHSTSPLLPSTTTLSSTTSIPITTIIDKKKKKKITTGPTLAATRIRRSSYETKNVSTNSVSNVRSRKSMSSIEQTQQQHQKQSPNGKISSLQSQLQHQNQSTTTTSLKRGKQLFTQEELLLEAVQSTEPDNERWILSQKRNQDMKDNIESLLRNNNTSNTYDKNTKLIEKFVSRRGYYNTITFPDMDHIPDILQRNVSLPQQQQPIKCIITGQVARYRDPKTGYGYYDSNAFRELRRRYEAKEILPLLPTDTTTTTRIKTQNGLNVNHQNSLQHHKQSLNEIENGSLITTNGLTAIKPKSKRRSKATSDEPKTKRRKSTKNENGQKSDNGETSNGTEIESTHRQNDLPLPNSNHNDTIQENPLSTINGDKCLETNVEPSIPSSVTSKVSDLEVVPRYKYNNHNHINSNSNNVMMPTTGTQSNHHATTNSTTTADMVNVSSPTSPAERKSPRTPKPSVKVLQQLMTQSILPLPLSSPPSSPPPATEPTPAATIQADEQIISKNNQPPNIEVKTTTTPPILPDISAKTTTTAATTISYEQTHPDTSIE